MLHLKPMRGRRLYKYFNERKWAEAFLEGSMRCRSLAYFRDYEDAEVRGDQNESIAILRPAGGLAGRNQTQGRNFVIPNAAVEFCAKAGEIFVYCLSKSQSDEKREKFNAVACVEIFDTKVFCRRVQKALPWKASFGGRPGHERLGQHVQYYRVTDDPNPRWACPDLIALSKLDTYAWQDEFRLLFSLTDALRFENISGRIVQGDVARTPNPAEHHVYDIDVSSLRDIAVLHDVSVRLSA
jgi:hypothetical protein